MKFSFRRRNKNIKSNKDTASLPQNSLSFYSEESSGPVDELTECSGCSVSFSTSDDLCTPMRHDPSKKSNAPLSSVLKSKYAAPASDELTAASFSDSTTASRGGVLFNEDLNTVHIDESDHKEPDRWYTREDISLFKEEIKQVVKDFNASQSRTNNRETWALDLADAFKAFLDATDDDLSLPTSPWVATPNIIALDRWVVHARSKGSSERRRQMCDKISQLEYTVDNPYRRAILISLACASMSRASRLYAAHVASWWASGIVLEAGQAHI